jgi:hypothetical protein
MLERTVGLEIEKAYAELKALLLKKGCKMVVEEPPTLLSVRQGSLWGISPRSAKKTASYRLSAVDSGTQIACSSSLSADWKYLTIIGSALSLVVVFLCLWISMDLEAFMVSREPSYWSWIATVNGYIDSQAGQMLVGLTRWLAVFLAIIIALEVVIAVYAHSRINAFAEETLNSLAREA